MTVWCNISTIFNQRRVLWIAGLLTLCVVIITMLFFADAVKATTGTNQTMSFQARLLQASGAVVPDGYYNIQFKIYQDGPGNVAGNTGGTLEWTESYINNGGTSGVQVKNGYLSVNLGTNTPFGTSVDWNQDTLWLSMNIAGSAAACTTYGTAPCAADGEMLPMKRITSVPQAMNSDKLDGKDSSDFIQNSTAPQTADFNITGAGTADSLNAATSVSTPSIDRADAGTLSIGTVNASTIAMGTNNANHTINIGTGTGTQTLTMGSLSGVSETNIQGGDGGVSIQYSGGGFGVYDNENDRKLSVGESGTEVALDVDQEFDVFANGSSAFSVDGEHNVNVAWNSVLNVYGQTNFARGLHLSGCTTNPYVTPGGTSLNSCISIDNSTLGDYTSNIFLGVTAASSTTARGLVIADARTGTHQPTIGVMDHTESNIAGFSWDGSTSTAYVKNTASTIGIRVNNTTDVATFNASAISLLQPTTASAAVTVAATSGSAFTVQNGSAVQLLKADTSAMQVIVGNTTNGVTLSENGITLNGNARNTKKINLVPEYAGGVLDNGGTGTNNGTMTSRLDLTGARTYYHWEATLGTAQTYDVVVKVPIPQDFSAWSASNPIAITTRTTNTTNGTATVELRDTAGAVTCNFSALTMGSTGTWTTNNPACLNTGTYTVGGNIMIRIRVSSASSAGLDLGDISLSYLSNK